MRPRQSSLGIYSQGGQASRLLMASMRPRQSSLGIPHERNVMTTYFRGFNEAEAIKPRNPS